MSFSALETHTRRLLIVCLATTLLVIAMLAALWATNTTATGGASAILSRTLPTNSLQANPGFSGERTQQLHFVPRDPGCEGANANSAICNDSSGGTG